MANIKRLSSLIISLQVMKSNCYVNCFQTMEESTIMSFRFAANFQGTCRLDSAFMFLQ